MKESHLDKLNKAFNAYHNNPNEETLTTLMDQGKYLVMHFIKTFSSPENIEDLTQAGYEGLLKAIKRYDPTKGSKFSSFAFSYVRGHIKHEITKQRRSQTPGWVSDTQNKIVQAAHELTETSGQVPNIEDIAKKVNIHPAGIREIMRAHTVPLDDLDKRAIQSLTYQSFTIPIEDRIALSEAIHKLNSLQKSIIYLLFYKGMTQQEAGETLNVSRSKVYRTTQSTLSQLKKVITK